MRSTGTGKAWGGAMATAPETVAGFMFSGIGGLVSV